MGNDQAKVYKSSKAAVAKEAAAYLKASNALCYSCKCVGHFAKDCPMIRSRSEATNKPFVQKELSAAMAGPSKIVCYRCNKEGHFAKDCTCVVLEQDTVEKLKNQMQNLQKQDEKIKKLEETIANINIGESGKIANENKSVEIRTQSQTATGSPPGAVGPANILNPNNFPGPVPNFNGPLPPRPPMRCNFGPPQMPPPNNLYMQPGPNQMLPPNQGQWNDAANRNQFNMPNYGQPPRPLMNTVLQPPHQPQNYLQPMTNQQHVGQNQQQSQYNKSYQQNQKDNRSQEFNRQQRGRGRGNFQNRRGGGGRRDQGGDNNNTNNGNFRNNNSNRDKSTGRNRNDNNGNKSNFRDNRDQSRGRNRNNNAERKLFSNEEPTASKNNESEASTSDKDKTKNGGGDNRQKKNHQGVYKGGIHKDRQRAKTYRGDNRKDGVRNGPQKKNEESNGDSDSTSTGYETAPPAELKNKTRRARNKNEAHKKNNQLVDIGPAESGAATAPQEETEKPLSTENNLGKNEILKKYIGSDLPEFSEAILHGISLYQRVEGIMLMSDPTSDEPVIETAQHLFHIIEFKSKYPNAKSYYC
ncbi:hypothetical protein O3M35_001363 [Rhynocoris fuscipes]|uniref:CCHC-type domain-containing protein n=1 Tax=Rhynocoris fuscipes TaxID=488301 RepID=A0AAW1DQW6_9HEMI